MAAKVGHDLIIAVTRWEATAQVGDDGSISALTLEADPRSLEVRDGVRGVKPLTDKDRLDIRKTIDEKVLGGQPISFRSGSIQSQGASAQVQGDLTMAGATRPVTARLEAGADGSLSGTIALTQSAWGIKPYRGLMGALKVRDDVEIVVDARLPTA